MLEATNASEAITSIENVLIENPLWLNKCTSDLFAVVKQCWNLPMTVQEYKVDKANFDNSHDYLDALDKSKHQVSMLSMLKSEQIIKLFQEIKTEYYNFKDNTQWNY
jgi:hypothetical protein